MFCAQCGQRVADGSRFCNSCGAAVRGAPAAAPGADSAGAPTPTARPASTTGEAPRTPVSSSPPAAAPGATSASASPPPTLPRIPRSSAGDASTPGFDPAPSSQTTRSIFARVKNIILSPSTEWPAIAAEASSASAIYLRYVAPLVAIGVIATFLGQTLVGTSAGPLGMVRLGIFAGLAHAVLLFGLSFLQVFLVSWLVDALAPTFGGQRNSLAALKVTAYSFTPGWVAAVLNIIPVLGLLGVLAALYGLYLLYLGLPVLMHNPKEKSVGYTAVLAICAVILSVLVTTLPACAIASMGVVGIGALSGRSGAANTAASKADSSAVLANLFGAQSDADRERVKQAQIVAGGKDVPPVDFHELKAMLPTSLPGMQRNEASGQSGEAMGVKGSSATARYSDGANALIRIEITDLGSMTGLAALAAKFDPTMDKETATGYERTKWIDGQLVHERYDRSARRGEVGVLVANRFSVSVEGSGVDPATLTGALKAIDLSSLAAMITARK